MAKFGIANVGAPMEVVAKVVGWLTTDPEAAAYNGKNIEAQYFCAEHSLLAGWEGPTPMDNNIRYDHSGANLSELEANWAPRDREKG
jgi:hypothetical protein